MLEQLVQVHMKTMTTYQKEWASGILLDGRYPHQKTIYNQIKHFNLRVMKKLFLMIFVGLNSLLINAQCAYQSKAQQYMDKAKNAPTKESDNCAQGYYQYANYYANMCFCEQQMSDADYNKLVETLNASVTIINNQYSSCGGKLTKMTLAKCKAMTKMTDASANGAGAKGSAGSGYSDPNAAFKKLGVDLMDQWAENTDNPEVKKIAQNYHGVRDAAQQFRQASPEYAEQIDKLEDWGMVIATITPFLFKDAQSHEDKMAQIRSERQDYKGADERMKQFEKKIIKDALILKEELLKIYQTGDTEKFNAYFEAYTAFLNTPISMYDLNGLMVQFYSDLDISRDWQTNMQNNPMNQNLETQLIKHRFNATIGDIYYGSSKVTPKEVLDDLFLLTSSAEVDNEKILKSLKRLNLYKGTVFFDYQPFYFALNYAHNKGNTELFEGVWKIVDDAYRASDNSMYALNNPHQKAKKVFPLLYVMPITAVPAIIINKKNKQKALVDNYSKIVATLNYSVIKNRYDLLKNNKIDSEFNYQSIFIKFSGYKYSAKTFNCEQLTLQNQAYALQLVSENIYSEFENAIATNNGSSFLSFMKDGMNTYNAYSERTSASNDRTKLNYFRPTFHDETTVDYFSTFDYLKHARPLVSYRATDAFYVYANPAFFQDAKLIDVRAMYYNAWAGFYRTGSKADVDAFPSKYSKNPYAQLEWLIAFGKTM